ncbi:MAG: hypothetical protein K2Y32_07420 [Candidatus Obscuribacterales bacterium]|nr:hypothetical protein [Candidatus Obscuribacterales bacterium]
MWKRRTRKKTNKKTNKKTKNPFANVSFYVDSLPKIDLPRSQRLNLMAQAGKNAEEKFQSGLLTIHEELLRANPLQLLCSLSFNFLHSFDAAPNEWKRQDKLFQHHLEVIQACALKHKFDEFGMERTDPQKLIDSIKEVSQLFIFKRAQTVNESMSESDIETFMTREAVRTHTQAVRNWGYPQHMHSLVRKLMAKMDDVCQKEHGIKASSCADLLFALVKQSEARMNLHLEERMKCLSKPSKQTMFDAYKSAFPICQYLELSEHLVNDKSVSLLQFRNHLFCCSDFTLPYEVFVVRPDFVQSLTDEGVSEEAVKALLDLWSLQFGDITEQDEFLFMGNPVRYRPFIKTMDDFYVLPLPGLLVSFCLQMLEMLFQSADSKKLYEKARAKFLEDEVAEILASSFPRGKLYRNSEWTYDVDGKTYENDALLVVDQIAIVCESKSGRVDESARRGGARLDKEIKELLIEPAEQATRFADFLSRHPEVHEFATRSGDKNVVDVSQVKAYIPLPVTLDDLNLRWYKDALPMVTNDLVKRSCPFLLSDFLIAMDVLQSETLRLHYLKRRFDFQHRDNFVGDEIDFLSVYMKTRLIHEIPNEALYVGSGEAHPIDEYYLKSFEEQECRRPEFPLDTRWQALLSTFDAVGANPGWSWISQPFLDVSYEDQRKIEKQLKELARKVKSGKEEWMTLTFCNASKNRAPIVFVVHRGPSDGLAQTMMSAFAKASQQLNGELAIGVGIDALNLLVPCTAMGLIAGQQLVASAQSVDLRFTP